MDRRPDDTFRYVRLYLVAHRAEAGRRVADAQRLAIPEPIAGDKRRKPKLVAAFRHEHSARLVEEIAGLVRFVPGAGVVEMLPECQHLRIQHRRDGIEVRTDEGLNLIPELRERTA